MFILIQRSSMMVVTMVVMMMMPSMVTMVMPSSMPEMMYVMMMISCILIKESMLFLPLLCEICTWKIILSKHSDKENLFLYYIGKNLHICTFMYNIFYLVQNMKQIIFRTDIYFTKLQIIVKSILKHVLLARLIVAYANYIYLCCINIRHYNHAFISL